MFYILSKMIWTLLAPGTFLLLTATLMIICALFGRSRRALRAGAAAIFGLAILALTPASLWLAQPLEGRFPRWNTTAQEAPYGIIALGGDSGRGRFDALVELGRRFPDAKLVLAGPGKPASSWDDPAHLFSRLGGDPERLIVEMRSRNTYENAYYSAELLKPSSGQRWLIVTSASHMPRAIGCFRHIGFQAEAYPVDFTVEGRSNVFLSFPTGSEALFLFDRIAKEWLGLIAYRLSGKIDTLFPGP
jgi:uncharacterized SAM-binding protein YcdF (DUF218 family)